MAKFSLYWKTVIAACAPTFLLIQAAVDDGNLDQQEVVGILVSAAAAVGVFLKANTVAGENVAATTAHDPNLI